MANGCMVHLLSQAMTEKENEQRTVDNSQALSSSVEANTFYEVLNLVSIKPGDPKRDQRDASDRSFTNWQELTFLGGKESCDKISLWCDKRNAKEIFLWSSGDVPMEDPKVSEKEQIAERGDDEALINSKILKLVGMDDYDT